MNVKGFLGPIGDDLPSLIPILFGLVIYFAVFNIAFQQYQTVNFSFNDAKALITLTETLKGDSIYIDADDFINSCNQLSVRGLNFKAAVVDLPYDLSEFGSNSRNINSGNIISNLVNYDNLAGENNISRNCYNDNGLPSYDPFIGEVIYDCTAENNPVPFKCSNLDESIDPSDSSPFEEILSPNKKVISRVYPVAYLDTHVASGYAVRIVFLVVAVWH